MSKPLTATEVKENWKRVHNFGCNCERCYVSRAIEAKQTAILSPLVRRVMELSKK